MDSLQILYLYNNKLKKIYPSKFNGLISFLHFNQIITIDPFTFNGLNSLKYLYLENNIVSFSKNFLVGFR
jgi:Leucine-rich repeat (LRR) protein